MEATRAQIPALRFSALSEECLSVIFSYLAFSGINALFISGNRLVRSKLDRLVVKIAAEMKPLNVYPITAFDYSRIRSLAVKTNKVSTEYYHSAFQPYYAPKGLVKSHNSLESLEIHGSLCFTILEPSKTLGSLLPNLTNLKLVGNGYLDATYFQNLPSKLIHLTLATYWHFESGAPEYLQCFSVMHHLPHTLQTLDVRPITFGVVFQPKKIDNFPPALTYLRFRVSDALPALASMPSSLITLRITARWTGFDDKFIVSKFSNRFPNLTYLSFKLQSGKSFFDIVADERFSHNLKELKLPRELRNITDGAGEVLNSLDCVLPPSLTLFEGLEKYWRSTNWSTTVPLLQHALYYDRIAPIYHVLPRSLLPPLLSLELPLLDDYEGLENTLPTSITKLNAQASSHPSWLMAIENLFNLKELILIKHPSLLALPSHCWSTLKPRLEVLEVDLRNLETIEDLAQGWQKLQRLILRFPLNSSIPKTMQDGLRSYQDKLLEYPSTLTTLGLTLAAHVEVFTNSIQDLTKLTVLSLHILPLPKKASAQLINRLQNQFEKTTSELPPSLTELGLFVPCELSVEAMRALPRSITILNLELLNFAWTEDMISAEPPGLRQIYPDDKHLKLTEGVEYDAVASQESKRQLRSTRAHLGQ